MQKILCFDFDGTLTTGDTLIGIIRYRLGLRGLIRELVRLSPLLLLMKMGLYSNHKAKEKLFGHVFGGMSETGFDTLCQGYASKNRSRILRPQALDLMARAQSEGARVMIVSASIDNWVAPFFPLEPGPEIVGTKIEIRDGRVTGRFLTPNCYGAEKVNRIKSLLRSPRADYYIEAFGDSRGDREMLSYADEGHYKPFRH